MIGQQGLPLGVEVDLTGDRMTVTAGTNQVANWRLGDISVHSLPDGFHIKAEGEEVILNVGDKTLFATEVGLRRSDQI